MRVLLLVPKNNYPVPQPHIDVLGQGLPYLAGALKRAGHQVSAVNINHQWCQRSAQETLRNALQKAVLEYQPQLIGTGGLSADYSFVRDALAITRQAAPHIPTVCGGGLITYDSDFVFNLLRPDFALSGDAEETLPALAAALEHRENLNQIPNLLYWKNGLPQKTRVEFSNTPLDDLAWPDYEPFDFETYLSGLNQSNHFFAHTQQHLRLLPISLGRSCPFKCTFCCHAVGPKYRPRSIDSAMAEIRHFYQKYHFNLLFIYDELFALKPERLREFCSKISDLRREGMRFDWTCALRVNNVEASLLHEMKAAGCAFIGYGLESASPRVLKSMKKGTTPEQIRHAINLTSEAGIGVQGNFIFGDVAETAETIKETMLFFDETCRESIISLGYLTPYPGSEIFDHCVEKGLIPDKKAYYEQTGGVGKFRLNMTQLPDADFFKRVDALTNITAPGAHVCLGLKTVKVTAARVLGIFPFDLTAGAPAAEQRMVYQVEVLCPHCRAEVQYRLPLALAGAGEQATARVYCSQCHRRFTVCVPLDQSAPRPKPRLRDTLESRRFAFCLAQDQTYFGSHMGALQGQPVRHAYMDQLVQYESGRPRAQRPMQLLEIGSWAGGSAITWANALKQYHAPRGLVVCVDPWKTYFAAGGISQLSGAQAQHYSEMERALARDEIFGLFQHNIRSAKVDDLVVTMRGPSEEVLPLLAPKRFDLIFVDGNHFYASVLADLRLAAELVAEGGILCGDDLELQTGEIDLARARQMAQLDYALDLPTQTYYHPGVTLAVGEFFGCAVSCHEGFWYMRKTTAGWEPVDLPLLPPDCIPLPEHFKLRDDFVFQPRLVKENCHGYNIVHYGERFFALHLSLGHMDLTSLNDEMLEQLQRTRKCVIGPSLQQVAEALGGPAPRTAPVPPNGSEHPRTLQAEPRGGCLPASNNLSPSGAPTSVSELTDLVKTGANGTAVSTLAGGPHPDYLIAQHDGICYAIPKRLGSLNLAHPGERNLPEVLSARNPKALTEAMNQAQRPGAPASPQLLEHNDSCLQFFSLEGVFLAADSARKGLDLEQVRARRNGHVFAAPTLPELKRKVEASRGGARQERSERTLVIGASTPQRTREIIQQAGCQNVTVLVPHPQHAPGEWPSIVAPVISTEVLTKLRAARYELVVVPYGPCLGEVAWESLVAPFCRRLLAVYPDGSSRLYENDHFSRVLYNMAYLRSMYHQVPALVGQRVLEIGCSDGLTCDLVAQERPASVVGVDQLETVGLLYQNPTCTFRKLDATTLPFEDGSFDLVYSIATFEHVADPLATLKSMRRVLRPGGYGYVQAAPLYYSPFGHHMFGYFDHYPWIHVRLSKTEIADYARANGIAARIEATHGGSAEEYINGMLNLKHVNGKLLHEYRLQAFASLPGVEVVSFTPSHEGENLLTPDILAEAAPVRREDLIAHGFELVFRAK